MCIVVQHVHRRDAACACYTDYLRTYMYKCRLRLVLFSASEDCSAIYPDKRVLATIVHTLCAGVHNGNEYSLVRKDGPAIFTGNKEHLVQLFMSK